MRCAAIFEVRSDASVVEDELSIEVSSADLRLTANIRNIPRSDFKAPFLLAVQVAFESESLETAREEAEHHLSDVLSSLVVCTGASMSRHRIRAIIDAVDGDGMRDLHLWTDSVEFPDPQPVMEVSLGDAARVFLNADLPIGLKRAMRWYRIGAASNDPEDQFQAFWFALEVLAQVDRPVERVADTCARCRSPLFCETCDVHPTHRPYPRQLIRQLIQAVEPDMEDHWIERLDSTRNALMHGEESADFAQATLSVEENVVDVLGHIVIKALAAKCLQRQGGGGLNVGIPTTYLQRSLGAVAHLRTIVPRRESGDFDVERAGVRMTLVADLPPQSAEPKVLIATREQHTELQGYSFGGGHHADIVRALLTRTAEMPDGTFGLLVAATTFRDLQGRLAARVANEQPLLLLATILERGVFRPG